MDLTILKSKTCLFLHSLVHFLHGQTKYQHNPSRFYLLNIACVHLPALLKTIGERDICVVAFLSVFRIPGGFHEMFGKCASWLLYKSAFIM